MFLQFQQYSGRLTSEIASGYGVYPIIIVNLTTIGLYGETSRSRPGMLPPEHFHIIHVKCIIYAIIA